MCHTHALEGEVFGGSGGVNRHVLDAHSAGLDVEFGGVRWSVFTVHFHGKGCFVVGFTGKTRHNHCAFQLVGGSEIFSYGSHCGFFLCHKSVLGVGSSLIAHGERHLIGVALAVVVHMQRIVGANHSLAGKHLMGDTHDFGRIYYRVGYYFRVITLTVLHVIRECSFFREFDSVTIRVRLEVFADSICALSCIFV